MRSHSYAWPMISRNMIYQQSYRSTATRLKESSLRAVILRGPPQDLNRSQSSELKRSMQQPLLHRSLQVQSCCPSKQSMMEKHPSHAQRRTVEVMPRPKPQASILNTLEIQPTGQHIKLCSHLSQISSHLTLLNRRNCWGYQRPRRLSGRYIWSVHRSKEF